MNESDFKKKLVAAVNAMPGGFAQRHEDKFAVGVLDMELKLPDLPLVFAEGKLIAGNVFGPTPAQFQKGLRILDADMLSILIGWKKGAIYLSDWCVQANIANCWTSAGSNQAQVELLREFIHDRQILQELRSFRRSGSAGAGNLQTPKE